MEISLLYNSNPTFWRNFKYILFFYLFWKFINPIPTIRNSHQERVDNFCLVTVLIYHTLKTRSVHIDHIWTKKNEEGRFVSTFDLYYVGCWFLLETFHCSLVWPNPRVPTSFLSHRPLQNVNGVGSPLLLQSGP